MPAPSPTPSRGELNACLDLLRLQIRLLHTFQLIDDRRYEPVARLAAEVGVSAAIENINPNRGVDNNQRLSCC
jgi:hypothetical protein